MYTYCKASFASSLTNWRTYRQIKVERLRAGGEVGESETGLRIGLLVKKYCMVSINDSYVVLHLMSRNVKAHAGDHGMPEQ